MGHIVGLERLASKAIVLGIMAGGATEMQINGVAPPGWARALGCVQHSR